MKTTLIMACSLDGFIARSSEDNPFEWTSKEDKIHFQTLTKQIGVMLMGGNTYKTSGVKSFVGRQTYVITNNPQNYEFGENVEAVSGTPQSILADLREKGHENLALVGGANANTQFLVNSLVDEMYITVEPIIFGSGIKLFNDAFFYSLELISLKKLNEKGTIMLHYKVNYPSSNGSD